MRVSKRLKEGAALALLALAAAGAASAADQNVPVATEKGPTGQASIGVTVADHVGPTGVSMSAQSGGIGGRVEAHTDGSVGASGHVTTGGGATIGGGVRTDSRGDTHVEAGVSVPFD